MKVEMLIVAVFILIIGFSIVRNVLPKEAVYANEISVPENETQEAVYDEYGNIVSNMVENTVDVSVFEQY